jgi:hypothetical protein
MVKRLILDAMPVNVEVVPGLPASFPDLDADTLDAYTAAFTGLGFRPLMDYTVRAKNLIANPGFARLLVNDLNHCFVEMNQGFPTAGRVSNTMRQLFPTIGLAGPMRCVIISLLEQGWTVSTGDREPSNWAYVTRRSKAEWSSRPGSSPQELLQEHLKLREKLTRDLQLQTRTEDTAEAYFEQVKKAAEQRKQVVQRRFALAIVLDLYLFDKNPKYQWQG